MCAGEILNRRILSSGNGQLAREFSWCSHWLGKIKVLRD